MDDTDEFVLSCQQIPSASLNLGYLWLEIRYVLSCT